MKYFIALVSMFITTVETYALGIKQPLNDAEHIVEKMIEAHGGFDKWKAAPSISYTHDMVDPSKPDDHWLSDEIHEQGRRRCYQNWRNDQAILVNDGSKVWTVDWKRLNPPNMMSGVSYFFINMVWMTQDEIAQLELKEKTKVDVIEKDKEFHTVRLTFEGASPYEYFDMYIDPETYLLRGVNYTVVHKDLFKVFGLPKTTKFRGPLLKVYKEYTDVDGLKLTSRYDTILPDGRNYGIHTVVNYSLKRQFDESMMNKPQDAVVFKGVQ